MEKLKVCECCLMAIQSHEGTQTKTEIFVDENNTKESRCDWCGESGNDKLYIIE